ncbi:MAG: DNA mismatch repair protein MutS, partial [Tissierellaceae bacterium]
MMKQYTSIKKQHEDSILFFRLGDFYEMFFEDAIIASKELEIALTQRDSGMGERAPMCGVPHHVADNYISRLVDKGYKVAICDQVEDPALAKGIVKREVVKVVTPGTIIDNSILDDKSNNYLASLYLDNLGVG